MSESDKATSEKSASVALPESAADSGCTPEKRGRMVQIEDLIRELGETRAKFGNTCVYIVDMSWGALALNRQAEDEKRPELSRDEHRAMWLAKSLEHVTETMQSYRDDYWVARETVKDLREAVRVAMLNLSAGEGARFVVERLQKAMTASEVARG